jgi:TPR repeat protein
MYEKYQHEGFVHAYLKATPETKQMLYGQLVLNARAGNPMAQSELGYMYANGIGCQFDFEQAHYWFSMACSQNYPAGAYNLASSHEHGEGTHQDSVTALTYYNWAAESGYIPAVLKLALLKYKAIVQHPNPMSAVKQIQQCANNGNPEDMFLLGLCYENGFCVPEDITIAEKLFNESAERNYVPAQIFLRDHHRDMSDVYRITEVQTKELSHHQLMHIWNFIVSNAHANSYHDWLSNYLKTETAGYQLQSTISPNINNVCRMYNEIMERIESHKNKQAA